MYATTKDIAGIKGISEQKVAKLKEIGGCWVMGVAASAGRQAAGC